MSDPSQSPGAPDESAKKAITLLGTRPPVPPMPQEPGWSWTADKLKAVYLEAFTDIGKSEIAKMVGIDPKTLFRWRAQGDYKRYMAELVYSDGLAEKTQRNKTRKSVADKLLVVIMEKLDRPGALAGEKVSALIKTFDDLLTSMGEDAASWERASAQAQAGKAPQQEGADLAGYIRSIDDPTERETVRRHLLEIFKARIAERDARDVRRDTGILEGETVSEESVDASAIDTASTPLDSQAAELSPDALE